MSNLHDQPRREVNLDLPNAEVTQLYRKLPQSRVVRNAQQAVILEDSDRPVKAWFPESTIRTHVESERVQ